MIIRRRRGNMRSFSQLRVGGYYKTAYGVCVDHRDYSINDDRIIRIDSKSLESGAAGIVVTLLSNNGVMSSVSWRSERSVINKPLAFLSVSVDEVTRFKRLIVKNFRKKLAEF